eukprot:CAMPEP_0183715220 /NCGR_PEP_ID=MMETSP0737-20130205/9544_1 /TAXON_ID=385413 /ORGANISM="Thalassiosira miniscula, Strain CCMP1093" /LENGTH=384 /DNA_ID=CAMNT_0025944309 /DNA_START=66 /DNA_END=1220 /DNA_ORIENTATION=+
MTDTTASAATCVEESECIFTLTPEQRNALLSSQDEEALDPSLVESIRGTFEKEGYVLVRGLLDEQVQRNLCKAGEELSKSTSYSPKSFSVVEFGPAFNVEEKVFRDTSLNSTIPALVGKILLGIDDTHKTPTKESILSLRLLKDAFMAKGKEEKHCGWHVDDTFFWPTNSSSAGVNVWIALDEIPAKYGGGMAVSPRSHTAEWREKAYTTIGSIPSLPPEGITPSTISIGQTCEMASLNPEMNASIEASKLEFDYQPGDCLFCHRWLFHRSVLINEEGLAHYGNNSALKRYTVRYERSNAQLLRGLCLEPCILMNPDNTGRSLDEVCQHDGPFYPRCWPPLDNDARRDQESEMERLAKEVLPEAQIKKGKLMADFREDKLAYGN